MNTRRDFLKHVAIGTTLIAANPLVSFASGKRKLKNIGYIVGIVGKEMKQDWKATLKKTADMGYTEIETGNFFGDSAAEFLKYCKSIGIKPFAGSIPFTKDADTLKKRLDQLNELHLTYAVNYWPWLENASFNLEDCKRSVEILNIMGEASKKAGLQFCWHNHDMEFRPMEEGLPFDYLMKNTNKDLVKCELDIYWTQKGGADPVETMKKYSGRYVILHVKDMAPGAEQDFECPGSGIIDWPAVFDEAQKQGIKHYIVERDKAEDGLACLRTSAQYLKNLRF
jgi:sugar phosphate isomerase/epimerase